jgi:hypothetical protein
MRARYRPLIARVAAAAIVAGTVSCGDVIRQDRAPVLIVIDSVEAASGATPGAMGGFLLSDVETLVNQQVGGVTVRVPTIFNDVGTVTMRIIPKDGGNGVTTVSPTPFNSVTFTRYRITFIRADGRNTPGVDVPYPFESGLTATVGAAATGVPIEIVRHQAKLEQPLRSLANFGGRLFISTIAEITFYGADQVGNNVQAKATIGVSFSDYGDPN